MRHSTARVSVRAVAGGREDTDRAIRHGAWRMDDAGAFAWAIEVGAVERVCEESIDSRKSLDEIFIYMAIWILDGQMIDV